ncbi:RNA polymerase sigma-70 factor [Maribellus comscasis]|uniref:RNA polymerase sigma-70 factor n=1 Tax=Maribellus comscasis TaxID=2681766 RepID=A0A6I6JU84_9BACT|nr:RNA polymerase sigma-70 factor [Maribellus comscasis]QGY46665.1 RNA polymerase sigma-70 factor [Maribellus comscasis]
MKVVKTYTEAELISGIRKDNHDSFQKIFERYSQPLYRFSLSYLKSKEAAEDVVQEVFTKVWANRKELKTNTSFQSYIFTIAFNSVRKYFNKLSKVNGIKHEILLEFSREATNFDNRNNFQLLLDKLDKLIEEMPDKRKQVFIKKKIEEKSLKEIAEELSITPKTVEYHITEAMKFLKKEFEELSVKGLIFFYLFIDK